jgi:arylsulfatase A-like enzyme
MHGAICVPSRAQLHTGQSLWNVNRNVVRQDVSTPPGAFHLFPEVLRARGYTTCGIGKWHNQPALFNRAYSTGGPIFFGGMDDQSKTKLHDYDPAGRYPKDAIRYAGRFSSEVFADAAIRFLHERRKAPGPWLCYVAFTSPHDPRTAPKPFSEWYDPAAIRLPESFLPQHPFDNGDLQVRDEMLAAHPRDADEVRRHIAAYYAMVSEVDAQIGRILDTLDANGQTANTHIVFAGDNGLAVGRHGLFGKQNLYEHSWRVPLVVAGPGLPRGRRSSALVHLMDLCPTILDLAGAPIPSSVDARSLAPALRDPNRPHRDTVYGAYRLFQRAIRDQRHKLIRYTVNGETRVQVFDLREDPHELRPLPARADLLAHLDAEMRALGDPLAPA